MDSEPPWGPPVQRADRTVTLWAGQTPTPSRGNRGRRGSRIHMANSSSQTAAKVGCAHRARPALVAPFWVLRLPPLPPPPPLAESWVLPRAKLGGGRETDGAQGRRSHSSEEETREGPGRTEFTPRKDALNIGLQPPEPQTPEPQPHRPPTPEPQPCPGKPPRPLLSHPSLPGWGRAGTPPC